MSENSNTTVVSVSIDPENISRLHSREKREEVRIVREFKNRKALLDLEDELADLEDELAEMGKYLIRP